MTLPTPNLDDRDFKDLVDAARKRIQETCPQWTDLSASDPGMVLIDVFAYLTDIMIYRLNRLSEKAYIEFLRLLGVKRLPPSAAQVNLLFSLERSPSKPLHISRGTRVTLSRAGSSEGAEPPIFVTAEPAVIQPDQEQVSVLAYHCEQVDAQLVDIGTGLPGQSVIAHQPPIIASTGDGLDLVVAVEVDQQPNKRAHSIKHKGKTYLVWREVEDFSQVDADPYVYVADRYTGTITFAPAVQMRSEGEDGLLVEQAQALAAVPQADKEIRVWYRQGGGPTGNIAAGMLTVLKDPIPGLSVTNPQAATGGRATETLDNAMLRGPQELRSLQRAVTARDFELVAQKTGAIARAKAFTRAQLWKHASPGTVEVLLVPQIPPEEMPLESVTAKDLQARQTPEALNQVKQEIEDRRPLGTNCVVNWVRFKTVKVDSRIVVHREENPDAVRSRVLKRLKRTINPLSTWPFGQALRASHVYDIILAEPGVRYVEDLNLYVDEAPSQNIQSLEKDEFHPGIWYASSDAVLFRTMDDGQGWERVAAFSDETIDVIRSHPQQPGLLVVVSKLNGSDGSRIHLSKECGEVWHTKTPEFAFKVRDAAWMMREGAPILLLATDKGLYEINLNTKNLQPVQILVDDDDPNRGFYAIATVLRADGAVSVAVAPRQKDGVFLSSQGGQTGTFRRIGLADEDIRVLKIQKVGARAFLWAGAYASFRDIGKGCYRLELRGDEDSSEDWRHFSQKWRGGSCNAIGFVGSMVFAGSSRAGVLRLDTNQGDPVWDPPAIDSGLPLRDADQLLHSVDAMAVSKERVERSGEYYLLIGGEKGVFLSSDLGVTYEYSSATKFPNKISLPKTWLFSSGEHDIEVVTDDETR